MAFTLAQNAVATATSGTSVTSGTLGTTPTAGQLLIACLRIPAPATTANNTGITPPSGFNFIYAQPVEISTGVMWMTMLYKVAGPSEPTNITMQWPSGTAASGVPNQAVLEYDEFDGFSGTPTLDLSIPFSGVSSGGFGKAFTSNAGQVHELALVYTALNNTSGAWKTGSALSFYGAGSSTSALSFSNGTTSSYANVGWCDNTNDFTTGADPGFQVMWTTARPTGACLATFYDLNPVAVQAIGVPVDIVTGRPTVAVSGGGGTSGSVQATRTPLDIIPGTPLVGESGGVPATPGVVELVPGRPAVGGSGGVPATPNVVELIPGKPAIGIGVNVQAARTAVDFIPGTPKVGGSGGLTATPSLIDFVPGRPQVGNSGGATATPSVVELVPGKPAVGGSGGLTATPSIIELIPGVKFKVGHSGGIVAIPSIVEFIPGAISVGLGGPASVQASRVILEVIAGTALIGTGAALKGLPGLVNPMERAGINSPAYRAALTNPASRAGLVNPQEKGGVD